MAIKVDEIMEALGDIGKDNVEKSLEDQQSQHVVVVVDGEIFIFRCVIKWGAREL